MVERLRFLRPVIKDNPTNLAVPKKLFSTKTLATAVPAIAKASSTEVPLESAGHRYSEIKSDMDLKRLPSGKFATNRLVMKLAQYAYNILRWIGMTGLLGDDSPKRKKAQRRRIRTVMQEIIYRAAKVVHHARRQVLRFSQTKKNFGIFERLYCC